MKRLASTLGWWLLGIGLACAQTASTFQAGMPIRSADINAALASKRDFHQESVDDFKVSTDPDDTLSFTRYVAWIRANGVKAWNLGKGKTYTVSSALDLTGFTKQTFDGHGSVINAPVAQYTVLDMLATDNSNVRDLMVTCGNQSSPCTNGIQFGRNNMTVGHPQIGWDHVTVDGYYTQAAAHNNGTEDFRADGLTAFNRYTASGCSVSALDSCGYAFINDGVNHWTLTSSYVTVSLTHDTFNSFNENLFGQPVFVNYGNGPAVWMSGTHRHQYQRGYIQVQGAGVIPAAVIYFTSGDGQFQHLLDWDVHTEIQPSAEFFLTGNANPGFFGLRMQNHLIQSNQVFQTDSGVSSVRIDHTDFSWSQFLNTMKIFDTPSKYQVEGELFMLNGNANLWNGPAFSGSIHTDSATAFLAAMTQGGGGFQISDPNSFQQINIPLAGPVNLNGGKLIIGSDTVNQNVELGNGTTSATPYVDFNGNNHTVSVRLLNDADGQLTFQSDGTTVFQIKQNGQVNVQGAKIVLGSDIANENLSLGNGSSANTPYIDLNGNSHMQSVRLLNDADGQLSVQSDGTTTFQIQKDGQINVQGAKIVLGSDTANQNLSLGNGSSGSTPYVDLNGNSHMQSVRMMNDADGQLTIQSDGTTNVQIRKTQPTLFQNGVASQAQMTANGGAIGIGSDSTNQNIELGNGASGATPYIDFNGNGSNQNIRIINDGNGQLTVKANGSTVLQISLSGQILLPNGVTTNNAVSGGSLNSSSGYVYASLPAVSGYATSAMVYCTNCLKPGESANSGTGIWVYNDGTANWKSMLSGTVAAH
jgi:hypothetical protein